jgi:hypothetical protein
MGLDAIKKRLQDHLSDGLVTVVGSGLSCAEGLPSMGELAAHLRATIGPGLIDADIAAWNEITPLLEKHGLEGALLAKAPTPALEASIAAATGALIADRERRVIAEVFSGARRLRLTRLLAHLLKPSTGLPIVTTNYDRLGRGRCRRSRHRRRHHVCRSIRWVAQRT